MHMGSGMLLPCTGATARQMGEAAGQVPTLTPCPAHRYVQGEAPVGRQGGAGDGAQQVGAAASVDADE